MTNHMAMTTMMTTTRLVARIVVVFAAAGLGCNIHEKQDHLNMLMEWTNYWYAQGTEDKVAYARAQRLAEKVLEESPDDVMAQNILGYCLLNLGPWDSENTHERTAKKVFASVLAKEPENYRAHLGMGLTYYKLSRVVDRARFDVFGKALEGIQLLKTLTDQIDAAEAGMAGDAPTLEVDLAGLFAKFSSDMRRFAADDVFPTRLYEALVPQRDRFGTGHVPEQQIRENISKRINSLLDAMHASLRRLPLDTAGLSANLDRLQTLLIIGYDHYRERYIAHLDTALTHFLLCERLHTKYGREYHWVFEYIGWAYFLKATTIPTAAVGAAESRRELLQLVAEYLEKFHLKDRQFEDRRLERMNEPGINKLLEENPLWSTPVEDFRVLMRELIDDGRRHRQRVIETLIDIYLNEIDEADSLDRALRFCDWLADSEMLFGANKELSQQPVKHRFYRAEIYRQRALKMEKTYRKSASDQLPIVPEAERPEHRGWWFDAYREYQEFLRRSSPMDHRVMRENAQRMVQACTDRYPEFRDEAPSFTPVSR